MASASIGAVGIIPGPSTDVYDNRIEAAAGLVRGNQKTAGIWIEYTYQQKSIRIFRNVIRNVANAGIQACGMNRLQVFNNVFRQDRQTRLDTTPIILCSYMLGFLEHLRISNNTLVDFFDGGGIDVRTNVGDTYSDWEIRNNLIHNSGNATTPALRVATYAPASDIFVDSNVVSAGARGSAAVHVNGAEHVQPNGSVQAPVFVSYAERATSNDFHLDPADTSALNRGADLATDFADDFDKVLRPIGAAWDIGAYEYTSVVATPGGADGGSSADGGPGRELDVTGCSCAPANGDATALLGGLLAVFAALRRRRRP